jgi:hypothetical protein
MAIQAAMVRIGDRDVVVVAVRPAVLKDDAMARGVFEALRSAFPDRDVALVASRSGGPDVWAAEPSTAAAVKKRGIRRLKWQPYAFA